MKKWDKSKVIYYALGAFLVGMLCFFSYARVFDEFEYSTLDMRFKLRPAQHVNKDIVIIEVADDSIEKLENWPFPRNYHALLIRALKSAGVKTTVFDIFFSEDKEGDDVLAEAAQEAGNVYFPYVFELDRSGGKKKFTRATGYAAPLIKVLTTSCKGKGFINVEPDIDGKIRRIPPFIEYDGKFYPHITVLVALNDLGLDFDQVKIMPQKKIIVTDNIAIPLCSDSSMLVNYPARWGKAFRHYSYADILQSYLAGMTGKEPAVDLGELKDTVCFIGLTATAAPDAHPSPMEPLYAGVGVHTSIYNSIMNANFIRRLNRWWNLLILALMWILTAFLTNRVSKRIAALSLIIVSVIFVALSMFFFWPLGIWIDSFYPLVTLVAVYAFFSFKKYITEIQKRELLEKELTIAKGIQQSFLPTEMPEVGGIKIGVNMLTARQVGGDLYDVIKLDDNRLGVMMGDVSGKGVPAALYMARVVSVFKTFVREGSAAEVVKKVNNRLCAEGDSGLFVTLTYTVFNTETKTFEFAIGGHLPTVLIKPDGEVKLLDVAEGMPLGLIEGDFDESTQKYEPGSTFIFYTDGVTEAMDVNDNMFEEERLVELAESLKGHSPDEIVEAIHKAVTDFAGKAPQHDDITVMVLQT